MIEENEFRPYQIYKITNLIDGKLYIGQTIDPKTRWYKHKYNATHENSPQYDSHLSRAIRKCGIENFIFEVIAQTKTIEFSDELEINFIAQYKSMDRVFGYNISPGGQGRRMVSQETREKQSKALKGRFVGEKNPTWGRHHTAENKRFFSEMNKGNKYRVGAIVSEETRQLLSEINIGKKATEETKKKMSESMIGKNKGKENGMFGKRAYNSKLTMDQAEEIRKEYFLGQSMSKLAKKYNVNKRTILDIIHNRKYVKRD
jgi:group I intron endonuclease